MCRLRIQLFFFLIICVFSLNAQDGFLVVNNILYQGNHHTKEKVIFRELTFSIGDTIYLSEIEEHFKRSRLQILSTGLFNSATLNLKNYSITHGKSDIEILVEENWYLYPVPIFELADRNFNVWWNEQGKSLSRVNYGLRISHYNFTGNRDPLKFKVHFGYTRKYELTYQRPYWMLDNKLGIGGSIFYSDNKEIAYKTEGNKSLFAQADDERRLLSRFRVGPELKYRPDLNNYHALRLEYHHNQIDALVAEELNPNYFLDGKEDLRFFYLEYDYSYDKRLLNYYPLGGYMLFANIKKEGLGIFNDFNNLSITLGFEKYFTIKEKLIFGTRNKGKTNLIRNQIAFANNTGIGWDQDIVGGYELYVMDGTDYFISMNNVKFQIFDKNMRTASWLPRQFQKMNMSLFVRANFDFAYINEPTYKETNSLNNRLIYGYGPAVDIILFNNFLISFEYSFNDIGEQGLYLSNSFVF